MTTARLRATSAATAVLGSLSALTGPAGATSADPPAPAARADVRVTIDQSGSVGRVLSTRAACERGRAVVVLRRIEGELDFGGEDETDRDGRWTTRAMQRGGTAVVFAVVPGDRSCEVAQSRSQTIFVRGARPARRTVTLTATAMGTRRGRVTSARPACERGADVALFGRSNARSPWLFNGSTTTDGQGRYDFRMRRARGDSYQLTTVVIGTTRCAVAQSGVETVSGR